MKLGVCYYPEQWDRAMWADDAKRMSALGLAIVRIGEFAWSFMEPSPGHYTFDWLDEAIDTLGKEGLQIILGTPTATPPKWLIDHYPDILAYDKEERPRKFGSRRHYCFSSERYRLECARIVNEMVMRYADNPHILGWQIDNEYGCHDTIRSYSPNAQRAFRPWLEQRYGDIAALNKAWGTSFWSQVYRSFDEIDLPNLTTTEPNPSHVLDFYRFSSDQVISFHQHQATIIRQHAPDVEIHHNFMGHFTDFDHFAVGRHIDVASWDSYPLGFLDQENYLQTDKEKYLHQGHPDFAGFHHDLYRGCGQGRLAVMEQQPGPVNWAPSNPAPLPGMVRAWTHEAHAHGAEFVSFFRWRQAPFAQENYHAGLLRHDNQPADGFEEVRQTAVELSDRKFIRTQARYALVYSYETQWMSEIKPQGQIWDYFRLAMDWYGALRDFGLSVDIVEPGASLDAYELVLVPSLFHVSDEALAVFEQTEAHILFGPRSGSLTREMHLHPQLAPGRLSQFVPIKIKKSESLPAHKKMGVKGDPSSVATGWLDHNDTDVSPIITSEDGQGLFFAQGDYGYLTAVPNRALLVKAITHLTRKTGIAKILEEGNPSPAIRLTKGEDNATISIDYLTGDVAR